MAIDVYVWLAYKLHVLQARTPLRWPALYAQFGAGFASIKNFRPSFLDALAAATAAYPGAVVTPHHFLRVSELLRKSVAPQAPMAG